MIPFTHILTRLFRCSVNQVFSFYLHSEPPPTKLCPLIFIYRTIIPSTTLTIVKIILLARGMLARVSITLYACWWPCPRVHQSTHYATGVLKPDTYFILFLFFRRDWKWRPWLSRSSVSSTLEIASSQDRIQSLWHYMRTWIYLADYTKTLLLTSSVEQA